jgi:orotate phosphoribosyltransferase
MQAEVARKLLEIKAIKLSPSDPFTWALGMHSPIYCDNRVSLSHPDVRLFIKQCLVERAEEFGPFDVVAGVATAGIPHGALLADAMHKPFIYVRSSAKDHGRRNQIEGELAPGVPRTGDRRPHQYGRKLSGRSGSTAGCRCGK